MVLVPPLSMVDDTLGVTVCGYKTNKVNTFLKTRTIIMTLQFGCDKCEQLHDGKKQNEYICPTIIINLWEVEIFKDGEKWEAIDMYKEKEYMSEINETKCLGDVILNKGSNQSNIKQSKEKQSKVM